MRWTKLPKTDENGGLYGNVTRRDANGYTGITVLGRRQCAALGAYRAMDALAEAVEQVTHAAKAERSEARAIQLQVKEL